MIRFVKKVYRWSQKSPIGRLLSISVALAVWLLVWHLAARALDEPLLLPSPRAVLARLGEWWTTALFWRQALRSLLRVLGGIVLGVTVAIPIAVCTALFPPVHTLLHPLIVTVKSTPVSSFIILAMLWIYEGIIPVFISFLMVFPIVWTNLHTAIGGIPRPYLEMARVFRLPLTRRIRRIYLPAVLPYFLSACESSIGLAWKAGVAAEVLALPALSIGKQLYESKLYLETTDLFAWTLVVILLSLLLEWLTRRAFRAIGRRTRHAALVTEQPMADGGKEAI